MKKISNILLGIFFLLVILLVSLRKLETPTDLYFLITLISLFSFNKLSKLLKQIVLFILYLLLFYIASYSNSFLNYEFSIFTYSVFVLLSSLLFLNIKDNMNVFCLMFNSLLVFRYNNVTNNNEKTIFFGFLIHIFILFLYFIFGRKSSNRIIIQTEKNTFYNNFILLSASLFIPAWLGLNRYSIFISYALIFLSFLLLYNLSNVFYRYYKIVFYFILCLASLILSYKLLILTGVTLVLFNLLRDASLKKYLLSIKILFFKNKVLIFALDFFRLNKEKYFVILILFALFVLNLVYSGKG